MSWIKERIEQAKRMQEATRCTLEMEESNLDTSDPESLLYDEPDITDERLQEAIKNVRFAALTKTS